MWSTMFTRDGINQMNASITMWQAGQSQNRTVKGNGWSTVAIWGAQTHSEVILEIWERCVIPPTFSCLPPTGDLEGHGVPQETSYTGGTLGRNWNGMCNDTSGHFGQRCSGSSLLSSDMSGRWWEPLWAPLYLLFLVYIAYYNFKIFFSPFLKCVYIFWHPVYNLRLQLRETKSVTN